MSGRYAFDLPLHMLGVLIIALFCVAGCGGKTAVIEQRVGEPTFLYEQYIHGINPEKISVRIYEDGYVVTAFDPIYSGEGKTLKRDFIPKSSVQELITLFIDQGFTSIEPLSMPAIYGGEVMTITFNYGTTSHTLKFLKGTKLPGSLEKCWDKLSALLQPLIED
jgi:hypothetical protein